MSERKIADAEFVHTKDTKRYEVFTSVDKHKVCNDLYLSKDLFLGEEVPQHLVIEIRRPV